MKTKKFLSEIFGWIAGFWDSFWVGFFEEERGYNRVIESPPYLEFPVSYGIPHRNEYFISPIWPLRDPYIEKLNRPKEVKPPARDGRGYPIPERNKPHPPPPIEPPRPARKFNRPNDTFKYPILLDIEIPGPDPKQETLHLLLVKKPGIEPRKGDLLYSYNLFAESYPTHPAIGPGRKLLCFENFNNPRPHFLLTSITETIEVVDGKTNYLLNYKIRDGKGKRRKFKATKPEQDGVIEALQFFYTLQYYETWHEYDETHDICPALGMKARELRDKLRRELCELGLRLGG